MKKLTMRKNFATKLTLVGTLSVLSLIGTSQSTFAALPQDGKSKATITFTPGTSPVPPVDPTDPSKPIDPADPENPTDPPTGNSGPLSLDYVSSVSFGSYEISAGNEIYYSTSKKPFIQVSDRRGTGDGWTVTAAASSFKDGEGKDVLKGAVLTLKNAEVLSNSTSSEKPTPEQQVTLTTDGTQAKIVAAKENTGLGTWLTRWFAAQSDSENKNVTLSVPAGSAIVGNHEATITWTLSDAPGK